MVLRALIDLSDGHDIMIVGFTRDDATAIAIRLLKVAKMLRIPCGNIKSQAGDGEQPCVRVRSFDEEARFLGRNERVHIDHAATFERGVMREHTVATIITGDER